MKNLKLIAAIFILLMSVAFSFAQKKDDPVTTPKCEDSAEKQEIFTGANPADVPIYAGASTMQIVPKGENAWTVQILTSGGIYDSGKGDLVFTSDGKSSRNQELLTENESMISGELQKITQFVSKVQISAQPELPLSEAVRASGNSICSDCYNTTFILFRREADGKVKAFTTSWDITTQSQVSEEILQIYKSVLNFADFKENPTT